MSEYKRLWDNCLAKNVFKKMIFTYKQSRKSQPSHWTILVKDKTLQKLHTQINFSYRIPSCIYNSGHCLWRIIAFKLIGTTLTFDLHKYLKFFKQQINNTKFWFCNICLSTNCSFIITLAKENLKIMKSTSILVT